jgi:cobalt-precorrin-5B (C1)-methyltransferase
VDMGALAAFLPAELVERALGANTANEVLALGGRPLANAVAQMAREKAQALVGAATRVDILVVDRAGQIVGESG